MTGAPDEPKQREPDCDTQTRHYPDGNHAEENHHGLHELAWMKSIEACFGPLAGGVPIETKLAPRRHLSESNRERFDQS